MEMFHGSAFVQQPRQPAGIRSGIPNYDILPSPGIGTGGESVGFSGGFPLCFGMKKKVKRFFAILRSVGAELTRQKGGTSKKTQTPSLRKMSGNGNDLYGKTLRGSDSALSAPANEQRRGNAPAEGHLEKARARQQKGDSRKKNGYGDIAITITDSGNTYSCSRSSGLRLWGIAPRPMLCLLRIAPNDRFSSTSSGLNAHSDGYPGASCAPGSGPPFPCLSPSLAFAMRRRGLCKLYYFVMCMVPQFSGFVKHFFENRFGQSNRIMPYRERSLGFHW